MESFMIANPSVTAYNTEQEWRVLLALAQAFNPAYACEVLNWRQELFTDNQTRAAFETLRHTKRQATLAPPPGFGSLSPYSDSELREVRGRMAAHALIESILPAYQGNLGDALVRAKMNLEKPEKTRTAEEKQKK